MLDRYRPPLSPSDLNYIGKYTCILDKNVPSFLKLFFCIVFFLIILNNGILSTNL